MIKNKKLKVTKEVQSREILFMLIAAYWVGYMSGWAQKGIEHPDVTQENKNIKELYHSFIG